MCGILGVISSGEIDLDFDSLLDKIDHRGPDDTGVYNNGGTYLGHQRLSIQDLSSNGKQPMFSSDGQYVIVFNGEIYNHLEIRHNYLNGYAFKSSSDTETILYGYIELGEEILDHLNGIFAFSILNIETGDLLIARDNFGVKPLYYGVHNDLFLFGSELKSLSMVPGVDKTLDHSALLNYINFLWSPGEQTPFQSFKKLLPGHFIRLNVNEIKNFEIERYYEIPFNGQVKQQGESAWIDELDNALCKAVERQLLSDVPIGYFLSGGLDSSLIVAIAAKLKGNSDFNCYTIKTNESENFEGFVNDIHYARKVAKDLGVNLIEVDSDINVVEDFDKMIWHLDEPQADFAPLNVYHICKEARKHGDIVLLGGTGGDDLFSGYRRHMALQYEKYFRLIPNPIRSLIKRIIQSIDSDKPLVRRLQKLTVNLDRDVLNRIADYYQWLPLDITKSLFLDKLQDDISHFLPSDILISSLENIPHEKGLLNRMLYWDMKYFLTDHNLNYTDKLSMALGIEVRVPYLDKELVELSTLIPENLKFNKGETKYLLKKVAERYLPNDVIYRPKSGFGVPARNWIKTDLDTFVRSRLSPENLNKFDLFEVEKIHQIIEDNKSGRLDASYPILSLLAIESWLRQFT